MRLLVIALLFFSFCEAQNKLDLFNALKLCSPDTNLYLRMARFKVESAAAEQLSAGASGNIKYNNQTIHFANASFFFPGTSYFSRLNMQTLHQITKTVPWPYMVSAKREFAKNMADYADAEYENFEYQFKQNVVAAWLTAWFDYHKSEIYQKHYNELDSIQKIMKEKGSFNSSDFQRISILQEEYLLKRNKLNVLVSNHQREIALLLNTTTAADFSTAGFLTEVDISNINYDSLKITVKKYRPESVLFSEERELASSDVRLHKNSVWEDPEIGILVNPQNTIPYLGTYFTITFPSFDLKRTAIAKAKVRAKESQLKQELSDRELYMRAVNAFDLYTINLADLQLSSTYKKSSAEDVLQTRTNYLNNKADLLTLLESEREYFQTSNAYLEALYDFYKSKNELLFQSGMAKQYIDK